MILADFEISEFLPILLAVWICLFIFYLIVKGHSEKPGYNDKYQPFVENKEKAEKSREELNEKINSVENNLVKLMSENKGAVDQLFLLTAVYNNFRIWRNKQFYAEVDEKKDFYSFDLEGNKMLGNYAIEQLKKSPAPIFSDFAETLDSTTLTLYTRLSQLYEKLELNMLPAIEYDFGVDWSNDYFFYTKVGNLKIPRFVTDDNQRIFVYPTLMVVGGKGGEFDLVPLSEVKLQIKHVEDTNPKMVLLSIKQFNFILGTRFGDVAQEFHDVFKELQQYCRNENSSRTTIGRRGEVEGDLSEILEKLNSLVGLQQLKTDFTDIANYIKIQQIREAKGLKTQLPSYHVVFTGNPGTGKTTIARMLADVYKELGIVSSGHLVEVDRSKLVGEYVGQTAIKTNSVIDEALDGILFIDEAYSLVKGGKEDFGAEAIATLLKRMEDDRGRLVVILAGYVDEMKEFIDSNPGLQSRFTRYLNFDDYSVGELKEIFCRLAGENDYRLSAEAENMLTNILENAVATKTKNFGNARYVRNLFEKALERQASRLAKENNFDEEKLRTIEPRDLE